MTPSRLHRLAFSLVELLVFIAIFSVVVVSFTTIVVSILNVQTNQSANGEVNTQGQFLIQQINYYVSSAQSINMTTDVASSSLSLHEATSSLDPTTFILASGTVYLQQGSGSSQALTSNKVSVSQLSFTRHYTAGATSTGYGTDSLSYSFTMTASSTNNKQYSQSFQSSATVLTPVAFFCSTTIGTSTLLSAGLPLLSADVVVVNNGYVYSIGGMSGGAFRNPTSTVYYASFNSDGSIGSWTPTSPLPVGLYYGSGVVSNGYVYVLGGNMTGSSINAGTVTSTVFYAKFNSDGTLGSWAATAPYPTPAVENMSAVAYKGYIYGVGGYDKYWALSTSSVFYAKPNSDGTIGSWTAATQIPIAGQSGGGYGTGIGVVVKNGYLYAMGGDYNGENYWATSTVLYAFIYSNGSLGSWTLASSLPRTFEYGQVLSNGNGTFLLGGFPNSFPTSSVLSGNFSSGVSPTWTSTTPLPNNKLDNSGNPGPNSSFVNGGNLYFFEATGTASNIGYYASCTGASTIAKCTAGTTTTYTGTGANPLSIAFDGTNMWVANSNDNSVTKISPAGAMTTYPGTGGGPLAIAFDGTNMWTANYLDNSVTKISPTGVTTTYSGTGNAPEAIAFDGTNMWTANTNDNSVTKVSPAGAMTTYSGTGSHPTAIAFDGTNMWTANYNSGNQNVTKVSPAGAMTTYPGTGGNQGIAFDGTNMWTTSYSNNSVTRVSSSGATTTYSGVGNPEGIAFDGTNMWITNPDSNSVTKVSPSGATTTYSGTGNSPYSIAFDGTNMWTVNHSSSSVTKVCTGL